MSFLDLYLNRSPMITSSDEKAEPAAIVFGVPFDSTHSYKPGSKSATLKSPKARFAETTN